MATKKYKAKCSQCGKTFSADTRTELLSLIRKHMWKLHEAWMKRRIKSGLKKRKQATTNPNLATALKSVLSPSWVGFAEKPVIEKLTGLPYDTVKERVLNFFLDMLMSGIIKQ